MWCKTLSLLALVCVCSIGTNAQVYDKDINDAQTMLELRGIAEKEVAGFQEQLAKSQQGLRNYVSLLAKYEEDFFKTVGDSRDCNKNIDSIKKLVEDRITFYHNQMARDYVAELRGRPDVQAIIRDMNIQLELIKVYLQKGTGNLVDVKYTLNYNRMRLPQILTTDILQMLKDAPSFNAFYASLEFIKCTLGTKPTSG